jgi:hypothetical protein
MNKTNANIDDLADHVFEALRKSSKLYYQPKHQTLRKLFNCLYFASMNSEEGELIRVRVAFYNPSEPDLGRRVKTDRWNFVPFDNPRIFDLKTVVKLSKSVDPWSGSLAVFTDEDEELQIYGLIDQAIHAESFLHRETSTKPDQAGLFQVSITGIGCLSVIMDYDLIATLKQDELVTEFVDAIRYGPLALQIKDNATAFREAIQRYIKINEYEDPKERYSLLADNTVRDTISRLLIQIRNYRHGGAILITDQTDELKVKYDIKYKRLHSAMSRLVKATIAHAETIYLVNDVIDDVVPGELFEEYNTTAEKKKMAENELKGAIRFVASHSRVDGLILLNTNMEELGYGAIIQEMNLPKRIYHAQDNSATKVQGKQPEHYGTRHQSMISFCWNNPGSIGFVVSQDADLRAFMRLDGRLVMWENIKTQKYVKTPVLKRSTVSRGKSV